MNRNIVFRAKSIEDGHWVSGELHTMAFRPHIHLNSLEKADIDPTTIGQFTGWRDKNEKPIFEGDIVSLVIPDGSTRLFVVAWGNQLRNMKPLPGFEDDDTPVEVTGWFFRWGGNYLLPSYIGHVPDYKRMTIVGNIYDNKEMLDDEYEASLEGEREMIGNTFCLSNKPDVKVFMYDLKDERGEWLARVILTSDGLYMAYSEYGNFYHVFNSPGKAGIRVFMTKISPDYFGGKLCEVDWYTSAKKVEMAARRHAKFVLPVLQEAICKQLAEEGYFDD